MEPRIRIVTGKKTRPTALKLKEKLLNSFNNVKLIRKDINESTFIYNKDTDYLINWGCGQENKYTINPDINDYKRVKISANKLAFFKLMDRLGYGEYIPSYNENLMGMLREYKENDFIVLRESTSGYGGTGITIADTNWHVVYSDRFDVGEDLFSYSLDDLESFFAFKTLYFKAKNEYRFYMLNDGETILRFASAKRLRTDDERPVEPNFFVRNHENGFIFQRHLTDKDIELVHPVIPKVEEITKKIGFNIVAFDVRITDEGDWKILEANTAPGLTGEALDFYSAWLSTSIKKKFS